MSHTVLCSQRTTPDTVLTLPGRTVSHATAVFVLVNCGDYPLIYLDDTDPREWHFILFYAALTSALLCCVALGIVNPGIRPPPLYHVLATGGDPRWLASNCGPPPDPGTLPDDLKTLIGEEYSPGKVPPKKDIEGVEVSTDRERACVCVCSNASFPPLCIVAHRC